MNDNENNKELDKAIRSGRKGYNTFIITAGVLMLVGLVYSTITEGFTRLNVVLFALVAFEVYRRFVAKKV